MSEVTKKLGNVGENLAASFLEKHGYKILERNYRIRTAEIDITDCPDLGPVLAAYAALRSGCTLTGTGRLKYKESDRAAAIRDELAKFGVSIGITEDSMTIGGGAKAPSAVLDGHNDHRIVMALAVMCAQTGGVIDGAEAVNKSFPDFFDKLQAAGIDIKEVS